jgi:hypothetical protein
MSVQLVGCLVAIGVAGCSPLLDADFDELPAGALANGTVSLPGLPNGDQMVVSNRGGGVSIEGGVFEQQLLRISTGNPPPAVTFRPVDGEEDARIFISYDAVITGSTARGRIVFRNLDEDGNSDNVPDMTLDFLQNPAALGEAPTTATGWKMNGIVGEHSVLLSISPDGGTFEATVVGDDVTSSPGVFEFSATDGGWRANPPNFEIVLTTDPGGGSGSYRVDNLLISEN